MHVSEYFQTLVAYGDRVFVFDGVKEPEAYGAPAQQADKLDPNYTTTTTTVTTTTVTTTTVPVTLTTVPKVPKSSTTLSAVTTTLVSPTTVAS